MDKAILNERNEDMSEVICKACVSELVCYAKLLTIGC